MKYVRNFSPPDSDESDDEYNTPIAQLERNLMNSNIMDGAGDAMDVNISYENDGNNDITTEQTNNLIENETIENNETESVTLIQVWTEPTPIPTGDAMDVDSIAGGDNGIKTEQTNDLIENETIENNEIERVTLIQVWTEPTPTTMMNTVWNDQANQICHTVERNQGSNSDRTLVDYEDCEFL